MCPLGIPLEKQTSDEVKRLLDHLLKAVPKDKVAMHFHDTFGQAADNVVASWKMVLKLLTLVPVGLGDVLMLQGLPEMSPQRRC